eukprot:gene11524-biopygen9195
MDELMKAFEALSDSDKCEESGSVLSEVERSVPKPSAQEESHIPVPDLPKNAKGIDATLKLPFDATGHSFQDEDEDTFHSCDDGGDDDDDDDHDKRSDLTEILPEGMYKLELSEGQEVFKKDVFEGEMVIFKAGKNSLDISNNVSPTFSNKKHILDAICDFGLQEVNFKSIHDDLENHREPSGDYNIDVLSISAQSVGYVHKQLNNKVESFFASADPDCLENDADNMYQDFLTKLAVKTDMDDVRDLLAQHIVNGNSKELARADLWRESISDDAILKYILTQGPEQEEIDEINMTMMYWKDAILLKLNSMQQETPNNVKYLGENWILISNHEERRLDDWQDETINKMTLSHESED